MVDKYIKEILINQGKVYVQNLGLIYKELQADDNVDTQSLRQPKYIYLINDEYINDDDAWLIYAVAKAEHITLEEAEIKIKERVSEIKTVLEEGGEVALEGIGTLYSDLGKLRISKSEFYQEVELDENFGIPSEIPLGVEEEESHQVHETYTNEGEMREDAFAASPFNNDNENYEYQEEEGRSYKGLIIAIIALLLLLGAGYYFFSGADLFTDEDELALTEEQALETPVVNDSSAQVNEVSLEGDPDASTSLANKPLSVKEAGKRYYIITGSFTINENAQKLKRKLVSKGVKAQIIEAKDSQGLFRVSLADYEEFDQALTQTEALKKSHGNSLWILKY